MQCQNESKMDNEPVNMSEFGVGDLRDSLVYLLMLIFHLSPDY